MMALEKDRDRRFVDAAAFAVAIAPFGSPPGGHGSARANVDRREDSFDRGSGGPAVLPAAATVTAARWTPLASRAASVHRGWIFGTVAAVGGAITIAVLGVEPRAPSSPAPASVATAPGVSAMPPAAASAAPTTGQGQVLGPGSEASSAPGGSSSAAATASAPAEPSIRPVPLGGPSKAGTGASRVAPVPSSSNKPRAAPALPGKKRTTDLPDDPG